MENIHFIVNFYLSHEPFITFQLVSQLMAFLNSVSGILSFYQTYPSRNENNEVTVASSVDMQCYEYYRQVTIYLTMIIHDVTETTCSISPTLKESWKRFEGFIVFLKRLCLPNQIVLLLCWSQ